MHFKFHSLRLGPPTCGYRPIKYHHYCKAKWEELGDFPYADGVSDCASKCKDTPGCKYFFIYIYKSGGHCYQSFTESEDCKEGWKKATYDSYVLDEGKLQKIQTGVCHFVHYFEYKIISQQIK